MEISKQVPKSRRESTHLRILSREIGTGFDELLEGVEVLCVDRPVKGSILVDSIAHRVTRAERQQETSRVTRRLNSIR